LHPLIFGRSLGDIHFAKPKSFHDSGTYASSAIQSRIEIGAINAMALRKGGLTSRAFDCGSQQINNVIIVKYTRGSISSTGLDRGFPVHCRVPVASDVQNPKWSKLIGEIIYPRLTRVANARAGRA
jgi:hypothetical protein